MSAAASRAAAGPPRRIIVLGATGSIGASALDIIADLRRAGESPALKVIGLSAQRRAQELYAHAAACGAECVALGEPSGSACGRAPCREITGAGAAERLVRDVAQRGDLVLNAIVGAAGLAPTLAAIESGCDVALANKESLVAAGDIVMRRATAQGVRIIPVDSEHAALALCLRGVRMDEVRRLVLTASGGPFLDWPLPRMAAASVDEALRHPNWSMGPKITIDCASLMNKAFELIEAHWLFGIAPQKLHAVVHPQSIVHGFVELQDGAVIAQLARADMKIPIRQAITNACDGGAGERLDLCALGTLEFRPIDPERFPAVALAQRVMEAGGTAGAIFNGANEAAVDAFRAGTIRFGGICELVRAALDELPVHAAREPEDIFAADESARRFVSARVSRTAATIRS